MNTNIKIACVSYHDANKPCLSIPPGILVIFKKPLRLFFCLVVFGLLPALAGAFNHSATHVPGALALAARVGGTQAAKNEKNSLLARKPVKLASLTQLLRLKLYIDTYNYDDIAIGFNAGASPLYNPNEDSEYMEGINAPEGLSCYSSDGTPLSVDLLPLPNQAPEVIRLDVKAQNSGQITLKRTELDSIPKIYQLWLVDKYKKDSINLRTDSNYVFKIDKSDTATFGSNRFEVVVSRNEPPALILGDFDAVKETNGTEITWTTVNEDNYTSFTVQRSNNEGITFAVIDTLTSSGIGVYSFVDKTPPAGTDQYRLKIQAVNGIVTYSNIITLNYANGNSVTVSDFSIYPNPANNVINLAINKNSSGPSNMPASQKISLDAAFAVNAGAGTSSYGIKILNITGYVIKTATSSTPVWQGSVANLAPGTYIVQVVNFSNNRLVGRSTFIKL